MTGPFGADALFGPRSSRVVGALDDDTVQCDVAVIGSGMGGATLAHALRESGARVLVVERGDFLPREDANRSPTEVFLRGRYKNAGQWYDAATGRPFQPGVHYYVGGNTKVFGACLPRFREQDFGTVEHDDGASPAWPVSYADLEPHYAEAERLYRVHGETGRDPTDPWRSGGFPYPALPHEPPVARLAEAMSAQSLRPFPMPVGVDLREGGTCVRCRTCDGFPCPYGAKSDAETCAMRPALSSPTVRLMTRTTVRRLLTSADGSRVTEAVAERDGSPVRIRADRFVLACGAVNTAALLLTSACERHPHGLANSSGLVGRNYMVHNSTFLVAVDPRRRNPVDFQKTLGLNDWYTAGPGTPYPLGNLQMLGKIQAPMVKGARRSVPLPVLDFMTRRSIDLYLTTEDLPDPANRITVGPEGRIDVHWRPNNLRPHRELVRRTTRMMRRAGYPLVFSQRMGIETNSHQCGTAVMGVDPAHSVLDPDCRAHDLANLWAVDSSCFPSSAALNPALTIAANALRVAAKGSVTA
ncbi:FAD-dependent oxidoreductase [Streptomyces sp. NPDC048825]|uniref:FAD-dependent oxidoreductase n=1 Tax=Streptomyces sp. NPDC048825 TaxID=3365592 RepID=UPI00371ABBA1